MKKGAPKSGKPIPKQDKTAPKQGEVACKPLNPHPKLFIVLMIGFVVWIGVLLALYLKTVYPMRYPSTDAATRPGASGLPNAPR